MTEPANRPGDAPRSENVDACITGGAAANVNCTRAGYLPVPLAHVPVHAFDGLAMYLRTTAGGGSQEGGEAFALYRGAGIAFTMDDRRRLLDHGVRLAYIRMADQQKFQQAIEAQLNKIVTDPSIAASEASAIVYETSVALIDEMVNDPELVLKSTRLENVSRAVTSLFIRDRKSFSHLFNVSHHDFYTATHLVNVATWMVPLAYALGYRSSEELTPQLHKFH